MASHYHPPGTPDPWEPGRDADAGPFLIDGCERCAEYVNDQGVHFDPERWLAFWQHMVDVEFAPPFKGDTHYRSGLDARLGRQLYHVALAMQRAWGLTTDQLRDGRP